MHVNTKSVPLLRKLGIRDSTAIVVGTVIGTGVFLKTAVMTQQTGSVAAVLGAWAVAGLLSLLGALTYSELAAAIPDTGGEYAFLREGYGRLPAFLFGWTRFWIISPGSIAAYAAGAATFFDHLLPLGLWRVPFAIALILFFSFVNTFSVLVSGRVQSALTLLKVVSILGLAFALFVWGDLHSGALLSDSSIQPQDFHWSAFGSAVLAALWAFDE
jgi:APA family basic amino acid/polyamine antiporter